MKLVSANPVTRGIEDGGHDCTAGLYRSAAQAVSCRYTLGDVQNV
jgi:hypothetical protein